MRVVGASVVELKNVHILQPSTIIVCIVCGNSISDAVAIDRLLPSTHLKVSESKNCRVQHARRWFTSFLVNHSPTNLKPLSLTFGGYDLTKGCTIHGHLRLQSGMKYLKDIRLQCSYWVNLGHQKNYTRLIRPESARSALSHDHFICCKHMTRSLKLLQIMLVFKLRHNSGGL